MQFQKGQPRPPNAGRKKGSLNKKRIPKVADFLANKDINPAEEVLKILQAKPEDPDYIFLNGKDRVAAWIDLLSYCQAKPAEVVEDDNESDEELLEKFEDIPSDVLLKLVKNEAK